MFPVPSSRYYHIFPFIASLSCNIFPKFGKFRKTGRKTRSCSARNEAVWCGKFPRASRRAEQSCAAAQVPARRTALQVAVRDAPRPAASKAKLRRGANSRTHRLRPAASAATPQNAATRTSASHVDFQPFLAVPGGDGPARSASPAKQPAAHPPSKRRRQSPRTGCAPPSAAPLLQSGKENLKPAICRLFIPCPAVSGAKLHCGANSRAHLPPPRGERSDSTKRRNPHKRIPRRFSTLPCRPRRGRPSAQRVPREATGSASPIETPPPIAAHRMRSAERCPALAEREGKFKTRNLPLVYPMSRGERSKATLRRKFPRALASAPRRAERRRKTPQSAQTHPTATFQPFLAVPGGDGPARSASPAKQPAARPRKATSGGVPHRNAAANRRAQDALCRAPARSCRAGRKI